MNPGGGSGWDETPLDIQIPDDARELDRDVLAYHRELRAMRRRTRLRRLAGPFAPFAARGSVMPLLASILAVCLVAGAMLSVATFSPATPPADRPTPSPSTPIRSVTLGTEEHPRRSDTPVRDQPVRGPGEPDLPPARPRPASPGRALARRFLASPGAPR